MLMVAMQCRSYLRQGLLGALLALCLQQTVFSQNLLEELSNRGLEFRPGLTVSVPPPLLSGSLTNEQLEQAKRQLAGNDSWEKFARDSIVAPVTIKLEYVNDSNGVRSGHNVHSAFVVYTELSELSDKDLMQQIFGKPDSGESSAMKFVELTDDELKASGVEGLLNNEKSETKTTYSLVEFVLLEKIRLSGVLRIERTSTPNSITIGWVLDPRFNSVEKWKATWSKIGDEESKPQPYSGWGGYLNVTRVSESPAALVVESRMLLHELPEWFSASNFIRSKLPLAIQEGARNFRRKLK